MDVDSLFVEERQISWQRVGDQDAGTHYHGVVICSQSETATTRRWG